MNKSGRGRLLVISGFSGVGKGTAVKRLLEKYKGYRLSVSATTRDPRPGECDGVHYHFVSENKFDEMIDRGSFLEYAEYVGHRYGTPKKFVEDSILSGENVVLEIETRGAVQIKENMKEALLIFLLPPDAETLKERLIGRGTESYSVIGDRLKKAAKEVSYMDYYDYFVINDDIDKCVDTINDIVSGGHPVLPAPEKVKKIKQGILDFEKGE